MSQGARITIGFLALFATLMFWGFSRNPLLIERGTAWASYPLMAFSLVVAVACFVPRSHPITLRILGATVCLTFLLTCLNNVGDPSFGRLLGGLVVFGIPGGYVAITGKYPTWGKASRAFGNKPQGPGQQ